MHCVSKQQYDLSPLYIYPEEPCGLKFLSPGTHVSPSKEVTSVLLVLVFVSMRVANSFLTKIFPKYVLQISSRPIFSSMVSTQNRGKEEWISVVIISEAWIHSSISMGAWIYTYGA